MAAVDASNGASRAEALDDLLKHVRAAQRQDVLMGVASLWDFAGALHPRRLPPTGALARSKKSIAQALREDWEAVGESMWAFMRQPAERESDQEQRSVAVGRSAD